MEHIVQFAIGIDDEAIKKRIEENAYNDILDKLCEEAKNHLPRKYVSCGPDWRNMVEDQLAIFCEKHRDEIIDAAAEKLCEAFKRTKAFKEKMAEQLEER